MQVWANFLKKYQEFENGNRLCFGQINRAKTEEYIAFIAAYTLKNGNNLAAATQKTMIACFQTTLNEAYKDEFISFNPNNYIKMSKVNATINERNLKLNFLRNSINQL